MSNELLWPIKVVLLNDVLKAEGMDDLQREEKSPNEFTQKAGIE